MSEVIMLTVYSASWCPHCRMTIEFLQSRSILFQVLDIETQADDVVRKVIEVNGGGDWVVPTLEFNGMWRKGKVYNPAELERDLKSLGVPFSLSA
jgi:mycoredoxin